MHNTNYLFSLRCSYKLSRREVATAIGMDISNYCRIENGKLSIQPIYFSRLKKVMPTLDLNILYNIEK